MNSNLRERVARAIDPVGWKWFEAAEADHPAKQPFHDHAMKQADSAIRIVLEAAADQLVQYAFDLNPDTPEEHRAADALRNAAIGIRALGDSK